MFTPLIHDPTGMFGGSFDQMIPMIKPALSGLSTSMIENLDMKKIVSVPRLKQEIDLLMTEKLELLTPELVKTLIEKMIRKHLGWLIVWGNVFGGVIGLVSQACRVM